MPNTTCLFGPPFSIVGNTLPNVSAASFEVDFDNPTDEAVVISCEWFLNGFIITEETGLEFTGNFTAGIYTIGVRILTIEGWSGVKNLDFDKV